MCTLESSAAAGTVYQLIYILESSLLSAFLSLCLLLYSVSTNVLAVAYILYGRLYLYYGYDDLNNMNVKSDTSSKAFTIGFSAAIVSSAKYSIFPSLSLASSAVLNF